MTRRNMDCEGIVTAVDQVFCYFELDNCIKVHMSILFSQKGINSMPQVDSNVIIKHAHKKESTFILCHSSLLLADCSLPVLSDGFIKILRKYELGVGDLVMLDSLIEIIEKNFSNICYDLKVQLVQSTIEFLSNTSSPNIISESHLCLNYRIGYYRFVTISSCRWVEINSDKYNDFPYWSFGVHLNPKNTMLLGYLLIHPKYGFLTLKDSNYNMTVILYNYPKRNIESVIDSYVLIKKFRVITEIYRENVPNVEYMMVNYDDIITVHHTQKDNDLCLLSEIKFGNCMQFKIIKKSMICIGCTNKPECWLHISIKRKENVSEEAFLILPIDYIKNVIHLEEHYDYNLFYNSCLEETTNRELSRISNCSVLLLKDTTAHFECLGSCNSDVNYLTLKECKQYVASNTKLVSFQGILKSKRFANTLPSRTEKHTSIYGFDTPGSKVHQLVFSCIDNKNPIYLDVYLNNWENILMPLGLIPQMKIIVKNVFPQSKKYLKSSAFTSFEVIAYEPVIDFQTVNLFKYDDLDWGPSFFLSHGHKIPSNVIIWGKIMQIDILKLQWTNTCTNYGTLQPAECLKCFDRKKVMDFLLLMHVNDDFGQSKVIVKNIDFMKTLLDIQKTSFQTWKKAFERIEEFTFNGFEEPDCNNSSETGLFKFVLWNYIKQINSSGFLHLDLKCRKLESNTNDNGGRPLWFCLNSRRSSIEYGL